jgi:hypothetical protein
MLIDTSEFEAITDQVAELTVQAATARTAFRLGWDAGVAHILAGAKPAGKHAAPRHLRSVGSQR